MVEQCEHGQGGGVAGGTDDHRLARGEAVGQRHDPARRDPRHLGVPTVLGDAQVVAVHEHRVARGDPGGVARPHGAGEVDAGHDRRDAGDPALLGGGQVVLVVDARPLHVDHDLARGQVVEGQLGDAPAEAVVGLLGGERGEGLGHAGDLLADGCPCAQLLA